MGDSFFLVFQIEHSPKSKVHMQRHSHAVSDFHCVDSLGNFQIFVPTFLIEVHENDFPSSANFENDQPLHLHAKVGKG